MTIQLDLPESITLSDLDLKMIIASKLYEDGTLSSGQASLLVGLSKRDFLDQLASVGVPVINYDADELEQDLLNA